MAVHFPKHRSKLRKWLEHDYFPGAERWLRRFIYNPLGGLCLAASAALMCGLFLHPHGLILFAGLSSVLLLGIFWPWIGLRGVAGLLEFTRSRITEGESVDVVIDVRNHLPWAAWGLAVRGGFGERAPQGSKDQPLPAASVAIVPGRKRVTAHWQFAPSGRGVYPDQPSLLCTGFPFGLRESKRLLQIADQLIVWPKTFPVGPAPSIDGDNQIEGTVSRSKVGTQGDVIGVRPYRRGDSPRRIHWAQSARHDRLIVCEIQSNARPTVQLVLDLDPLVHRGQGPESSREWAIRVFASFAEGWLGDGMPIEAVIGKQVIPLASGQSQRIAIMDALARIGAHDDATLDEVLELPACCRFDHGVQVIVTTDCSKKPERDLQIRDRRFVMLQAEAFGSSSSTAAARPENAWLWLDAPDRILYLLRHGWKEALHGS